MNFTVHGRNPRNDEPWEISLEKLAVGGGGKAQYRGRPKLLSRLINGFQEHVRGVAETTACRERTQLIAFWRFLDYLENIGKPSRLLIDDIKWSELDTIWRHFITCLRTQPADKMSPRTRYYLNSSIHSIFALAFQKAKSLGETDIDHLGIYVYFRSDKRASYEGDPLDLDEAKSAFAVLAQSWRAIKRKIDAGRALAATGRNPIAGSGSGPTWQTLANRIWAAEEFLVKNRTTDRKLMKKLQGGLSENSLPEEFHIPGLNKYRCGSHAYLSCVCLTRSEIAVAMAMVTMKTGFNPVSVARMEVNTWYRQDAIIPENRVVIIGPKRIGNYNVSASSSIQRATDPYQIIKFVIDTQEPFRDRLRRQAEKDGNEELLAQSRLVWIYPDTHGNIKDATPQANGNRELDELNKAVRSLFSHRELLRKDGSELRYNMSDGRDIWGLFVYHKSGFNSILTAKALGHRSLASLLHYLEKRVTRIEDRKRLIDLQGRVLADLQSGKFLPHTYREGYPATPAETAVTGLHCTDPFAPDPDADPGNAGGAKCKAQGCWTCSKWFATKESVPYLIRMISDLESIRASTSLAIWETSDYPIMHAIYSHILQKFDSEIRNAGLAQSITLPEIIAPRRFIDWR